MCRWTNDFYWVEDTNILLSRGTVVPYWLLCSSPPPSKLGSSHWLRLERCKWQEVGMLRRRGRERKKKKTGMRSPLSATCMSVAMGFVPPQSLTLLDYLYFMGPGSTSHILCGTIHKTQQTAFSPLCGSICPIITASGELAISCLTSFCHFKLKSTHSVSSSPSC